MDLYVAICEDRHIDIVVRVFSTADKAIQYCKDFLERNARYPDEIKEEKIADWIYYARYSCEGDNVQVRKTTLDIE